MVKIHQSLQTYGVGTTIKIQNNIIEYSSFEDFIDFVKKYFPRRVRIIKSNFDLKKQGIKNLIKWFPIILRDRDFDEKFLLDIMSFKMQNMANFLRKYGFAVDAEKRADQLEACAILAKRISDEAYGEDISSIEEHDFRRLMRVIYHTIQTQEYLHWK